MSMRKNRQQRPCLTVAADCLLQHASAEVIARLKKELTIANPKYRDAKRYGRWIGKKIKPFLFYYEEVAAGIRFPRGFANKAVALCRDVAGEKPDIDDQRLLLPAEPFQPVAALRPYQSEAVAAALSRSFGVLEAGTGSGKTVMALAVIAERRQPTLVVVHTRELLYQWQERVRQFLHLEAVLIGSGHFQIGPVTVGIVNTLRRRKDELRSSFGQIIVDECHRVPATVFTEVVSAFPGYYMLGLSATAFRREEEMTRLIHLYLGETVFRVRHHDLAEEGAVLRPEFIQRPTEFSRFFKGDYSGLLQALVADHGRNRLIARDIIGVLRKEEGNGTLLVVSDRVGHCRALAQLLHEAGADGVVLTGKTPWAERAEIVEQVRRGEVRVLLATIQLIGEGFDCPGLDTLFLATPIKFEGRLQQVVGRILRPAVDKKPRVFDYVDSLVPVLARSGRERRKMYDDFSAGPVK